MIQTIMARLTCHILKTDTFKCLWYMRTNQRQSSIHFIFINFLIGYKWPWSWFIVALNWRRALLVLSSYFFMNEPINFIVVAIMEGGIQSVDSVVLGIIMQHLEFADFSCGCLSMAWCKIHDLFSKSLRPSRWNLLISISSSNQELSKAYDIIFFWLYLIVLHNIQ